MSVPFDREKKAPKGILKNTSSFDTEKTKEQRSSIDKGMKWDEMNILATYHPADKDYGHDKINEPPTPYYRDENISGDEDPESCIDPQLIADGLTMKTKSKLFPKADTESDEDDEENMTEEQKEHKKAFRLHRKEHYNEFQAVKLARKLLEQEDDEDDDDKDKEAQEDVVMDTGTNN